MLGDLVKYSLKMAESDPSPPPSFQNRNCCVDLDDSGIEDLRQEIMAAHRSGRGPLPRRDRRGVGGRKVLP